MGNPCGLPGCEVEVPVDGGCARCKSINYCGVAHQREDWRRHKMVCSPSPVYNVVEVAGKGRGLVATRVLDVGQLVITDKPLLMIQGLETPPNIRRMLEDFEKLSAEKKAKIMAMTDPGVADHKFDHLHLDDVQLQVARKFNTNSLGLGDDLIALYENISLINHSCSPNVFWVDGTDGVSSEVRVCRRIEQGEEIVASYYVFSDFPLRQERINKISKDRYFQCRCDLCSLFGVDLKTDEDTRKVIMKLHREVDQLFNRSGPAMALKAAEQKLDVMEKIRDRIVLRFPEALLECFNLAAMAGKKDKMMGYKERALTLSTSLSKGHKEKAEKRVRMVEMEVRMAGKQLK